MSSWCESVRSFTQSRCEWCEFGLVVLGPNGRVIHKSCCSQKPPLFSPVWVKSALQMCSPPLFHLKLYCDAFLWCDFSLSAANFLPYWCVLVRIFYGTGVPCRDRWIPTLQFGLYHIQPWSIRSIHGLGWLRVTMIAGIRAISYQSPQAVSEPTQKPESPCLMVLMTGGELTVSRLVISPGRVLRAWQPEG